ncbi:MAG: hypothetical protein AMK75_00050 [Planctomycetes bacterium SM23_65]|nr:MAG: hypothetical protein AMK75_00050 [Planctomycetes bacterium SM23_65]
MKRTFASACVVLLLLASWLSAKDIEPRRGWVTGEHAEKAVAYAKKKGMPIVFLYAYSQSSCPKHNARADTYMRDRSLNGMVRVLVYCDKPRPAAFTKVVSQVGQDGVYVPRMYIADPELRLLGFVRNNVTGTKLARIASLGKRNMAWQGKTVKALKKAEKLAADGKFNAALEIYKLAEKEDKGYGVLIARTWDEQLSAADAEPAFFPELAQKKEELARLAQTRLDQATELYEKQNYAEAKKLLEPMVRDKANLEAVAKATELLKKVREALKKKP